MNSQSNRHQEILFSELKSRKARNPAYSLRSFARDLGISPGFLSSLMSGKRNLTIRQASSLSKKLGLSPEAQRRMLHSAAPEFMNEEELELDSLRLLKEDEFALISDWHHFAILNLTKLPGACSRPSWIAKSLNITELQAADAVKRLERLGYISIEGTKIKRLVKPLRTTTDVTSTAIRNHHKQNLDLAREKIESVSVENREYSSMTMAVDPSKLPKIKKLIDEFKERLCKEFSSETPKEVYTFSVQLFPLTAMRGKK